MSIELVMPLNTYFILCHPLLLLRSIFPIIRVFSNESALFIRWPKYWNFSFSRSNEYSRLISFRIDWIDLLAVQGTLKSLLQHRSLKASIFWHSAFFMVQLSHPYVTNGKTMALTIRTFIHNPSSVCWKGLEVMTPSNNEHIWHPQVFISNHHSLIKGAKDPQKNGQFQGWRGEIKDEPGLSVVPEIMAVL